MLDTKEIISFLLEPKLSGWLLFLKILFIAASAVFLGFIIFALAKTSWLKRMIIWDLQEILTYRPFGVSKVEKSWQKIKAGLETGIESEYKLSVIKADKILDDTLNRMGFGGVSLGERLDKLTTASLPNLEEVRAAHKIRNNVIHDPDYRLSLEDARKAIAAYEKALTDLQAL